MSHLSTSTPAASSYAARQRAPRRHLTGIALVVLLHALLLWAITSGLAKQVVRLTENTVEAVLMTEAPPPKPAPAPIPLRRQLSEQERADLRQQLRQQGRPGTGPDRKPGAPN